MMPRLAAALQLGSIPSGLPDDRPSPAKSEPR